MTSPNRSNAAWTAIGRRGARANVREQQGAAAHCSDSDRICRSPVKRACMSLASQAKESEVSGCSMSPCTSLASQ